MKKERTRVTERERKRWTRDVRESERDIQSIQREKERDVTEIWKGTEMPRVREKARDIGSEKERDGTET